MKIFIYKSLYGVDDLYIADLQNQHIPKATGINTIVLDDGLANGMYLLELSSQKEHAVFKVMLEK